MKRRRLCTLLPAVLATQGLGPGPAAAQVMLNGFDLSGASGDMRPIESGGPPKDGIPAID